MNDPMNDPRMIKAMDTMVDAVKEVLHEAVRGKMEMELLIAVISRVDKKIINAAAQEVIVTNKKFITDHMEKALGPLTEIPKEFSIENVMAKSVDEIMTEVKGKFYEIYYKATVDKFIPKV